MNFQLRIGQTRWVVRAMDRVQHVEKWRLEWRELTPIVNFGTEEKTKQQYQAAYKTNFSTEHTSPSPHYADSKFSQVDHETINVPTSFNSKTPYSSNTSTKFAVSVFFFTASSFTFT
jgi:hypothetical protein